MVAARRLTCRRVSHIAIELAVLVLLLGRPVGAQSIVFDAAATPADAAVSGVDASDTGGRANQALARESVPSASEKTSGAVPSERTAGETLRVSLGLIALIALAILAGRPSVAEIERRSGLSMFASTGVPFLLIGMLARTRTVGVFSDEVLHTLQPVLEFGLGWIGFRVGTHFDVRELDRMPRGAALFVATHSITAFLASGAVALGALALVGGFRGDTLVRDGLLLAASAAVSSPSGVRTLESAGLLASGGAAIVRRMVQLDDAVPIVVLALLTSVFRPIDGGAWQLPPLAWLFVQIGLGTVLGGFCAAMVRGLRSEHEEIALAMAGIAFASGMAGYLGFSPLAVGCVAGIVHANVRGHPDDDAFSRRLGEMERPIFMVFFAIAGAMWSVRAWQGWVIVPLFLLARWIGKMLGTRVAYGAENRRSDHPASSGPSDAASQPATQSWIAAAGSPSPHVIGSALLPASEVSIAVVVSAQQMYVGAIAPAITTIVIVGAVITDVLFQFRVVALRRAHDARTPSASP